MILAEAVAQPTLGARQLAARLLRTARPRSPGLRALRRLAADLITEIRYLDRRITTASSQIANALRRSGCALAELPGMGELTAAKILARVGCVRWFRSAAAFAAFNGTAPTEVSSGDVVRHRLSRAGDRQLNCCLHVTAITQIRRDTPGRAYYRAKRPAGKSHKEVLRCVKRRLSDVVYRRLVRDNCHGLTTGPAGHAGAASSSCAAGSTPRTPALRISHFPDPPAPTLQLNQRSS